MSQPVTATSNLFDYFNSQVKEAAISTGTELSYDTQLYLASLLTERARSDNETVTADTLAEIHARAAIARPGEQARVYRELGDRALYSVGYFTEHCTRRTVNESYYLEMGSAAYYQVDQVFKRWFANAFGHVFKELSTGFHGCVNIYKTVRNFHREDDVMSLYRQWRETGSLEISEHLENRGLILIQTSSIKE